MQNESLYQELVRTLKRIHTIGTVGGLLGWDEQVNLPPESAGQRADQLAVIAELQHAAASSPRLGEVITALERQADALGLNPDQRLVVRWARRDYDRATRLPSDFVSEKARHNSETYHAWAEARGKADFAAFAPFLEKHLELARREAGYMGRAADAYDYFIDQFDPGMKASVVQALFSELKQGLVPFVAAVKASSAKANPELLRGFPIEKQRVFLREVSEKIGFDYNHGRIDVSLHPFCEGCGSDVRMTTRFDENNPLDSLTGAVHETGHGLYEQGTVAEHRGTALGQSVGMGVHESQSRLWENQVARGRPFWRYFEPRFRELFPTQLQGVGSDELYLALNAVEPSLIRVASDEVTYNLHIILRFELEQRLFNGSLAVRDLPAAWNALSAELLGMTPKTDAEGVLQDVHWACGMFGYFPSYTVGNMMAAQLWYKAHTDMPDLDEEMARGDFSKLLGWLREKVHRQGRRYDTRQLAEFASGEPLSPRALLRYLKERYGPLYGV